MTGSQMARAWREVRGASAVLAKCHAIADPVRRALAHRFTGLGTDAWVADGLCLRSSRVADLECVPKDPNPNLLIRSRRMTEYLYSERCHACTSHTVSSEVSRLFAANACCPVSALNTTCVITPSSHQPPNAVCLDPGVAKQAARVCVEVAVEEPILASAVRRRGEVFLEQQAGVRAAADARRTCSTSANSAARLRTIEVLCTLVVLSAAQKRFTLAMTG